jgi:MFS family permease
MLLYPWPDEAWQLGALVILTAPAVGMLWAPSMALLSDGADALGIAQGFAFALSNLGWSIGQTAGAAASARLADATSDTVPYLLLSVLCGATIAILARTRRTSPI